MMRDKIFDIIRRRYVAFTPEEEVRQNTIQILINDFSYPKTRFSVEGQINVGNTIRRYDIVVMNKDRKPFMLIECKAKDVKLDENVISQATSYNITLNAPYVLITNNLTTIILHKVNNEYFQEQEIPQIT